MMTLAVTGAPDSHRGHVFFWRAPSAPFFVCFRTDFMTSVWVLPVSDGVLALGALWPAGVRKPQGGAPLPPLPPLAMSLMKRIKAADSTAD